MDAYYNNIMKMEATETNQAANTDGVLIDKLR